MNGIKTAAREILFKAKAVNRENGTFRSTYQNGDWVYGLVTRMYDSRYENLPATMTDVNGISNIEIDHTTICEYSGWTDKNNNKIFEGDYWIDDEGDVYVVEFRDGKFCFVIYGQLCESTPYGYDECFGSFGECDCDPMDYYCINQIDFMGNVYDNLNVINPYLKEDDIH